MEKQWELAVRKQKALGQRGVLNLYRIILNKILKWVGTNKTVMFEQRGRMVKIVRKNYINMFYPFFVMRNEKAEYAKLIKVHGKM